MITEIKKKIPLLIYGLVLIAIIYFITHAINISNDLKKGTLIKDVYILDAHYSSKLAMSIFHCKLNHKGQQKLIFSSSSISNKIKGALVGHYFPAMYSQKHNRLDLLVLAADFEHYNLPYPDSLRWVDSLNRIY